MILAATVPAQLESFARGLATTYANARWPVSEIYSVVADAIRVAAHTAKLHADPSCVALSRDELEAELRQKTVEVFRGSPASGRRKAKHPILDWIPDRKQLFKYLTTCFNNHARGLVHKHRFTAKRTGTKVPKKGSPELARWVREHQKPEVSLDANPELRSGKEFFAAQSAAQIFEEASEDMQDLLSPLEFIVWEQVSQPNEAAWVLAQVDSCRGKNPKCVKITFEHYAAGVGLSVEDFTQIAEGVHAKFTAYRRGGDECRETESLPVASPEQRARLAPVEFLVYTQLTAPNRAAKALAEAQNTRVQWPHLAAGIGMEPKLFRSVAERVKKKIMDKAQPEISELENVFGVQVPRSVDATIVRRLFTMVARSAPEKVTDGVAALLQVIGADVPKRDGHGNLTCFGVLYSRNHPVCIACQAKKSCRTRAMHFGLENISIHPSLLPAPSSVRTAAVFDPDVVVPPDMDIRSSLVPNHSEEICSYLDHNFRRADSDGKTQYYLRSNNWLAVTVSEHEGKMSVRLVNASPAVQDALEPRRGVFVIPEKMKAKEACALIDRHANELFAASVREAASKAVTRPAEAVTKLSVTQQFAVAAAALVARFSGRKA